MAVGILPVVGSWYQSPDGQRFEVIGIDDDEGFVEIQHFGGELDALEFDAWLVMGYTEIAAPEDWSGPFDDLERDDLGYTDTNVPPEHRTFNIEDFERKE
ncbi:MAG: hypothetical protein KAU29_05555 [Gammaproteobacteria bacterium]|nr:hypothetical protein [Gammaproteobacteria bacterium]